MRFVLAVLAGRSGWQAYGPGCAADGYSGYSREAGQPSRGRPLGTAADSGAAGAPQRRFPAHRVKYQTKVSSSTGEWR